MPFGTPLWWFDFNDFGTLWNDDERTGGVTQGGPISYVDNKGSDTEDIIGAAEPGDATGESAFYNVDSFAADELGWGLFENGDGTVTMSGTFPGAANPLSSHSGMMVFSAEAWPANSMYLMHSDAEKSGVMEVQISPSGDSVTVSSGLIATVTAEIPVDTIVALVWNSTTGDLHVSWSETVDEFAASPGSTLVVDTTMGIGMNPTAADENLSGWLGEVLLYDSDIEAAGIAHLVSYASTKWGVVWT